MQIKIEDDCQAFPHRWDQPNGMSLRDWFAGKAIPALIEAATNQNEPAKIIATAAYEIADAMIALRKAGA